MINMSESRKVFPFRGMEKYEKLFKYAIQVERNYMTSSVGFFSINFGITKSLILTLVGWLCLKILRSNFLALFLRMWTLTSICLGLNLCIAMLAVA